MAQNCVCVLSSLCFSQSRPFRGIRSSQSCTLLTITAPAPSTRRNPASSYRNPPSPFSSSQVMILRPPHRTAATRSSLTSFLPSSPAFSPAARARFHPSPSQFSNPSPASSEPHSPPSGRTTQPTGHGARLSFWPFFFIFLLSSGSYALIVKRRTGQSASVPPENRRKAHNER